MPLKAYKMKKLYATNKALLSNKNLYPFLIMAILLISTVYSSYGQVRVPFTPRTSSTTPTTTVYNVKGDFTMIRNTNLTLLPPLYTNTANNNNDMQYVPILFMRDCIGREEPDLELTIMPMAIITQILFRLLKTV